IALLLLIFNLTAQPKTICLNMIVKNESPVIETCLGSLKHLIDYWVIVDTGSTDGTQETIKKFLHDIPGELHERPWVDFAHNRNEALALAKNKADYLLLIDADESLHYSPDFTLPTLDKDFYFFTVRQLGQLDFKRIGLIDTRLDWKWEGILHENLSCPTAATRETLKGLLNICNASQGARARDPTHFLKDAQVLEKALEKDPTNSRNVFYLAQSYLNAGKFDLALKNYIRRSQLPSPDVQETYLTLYMIGIIQELTHTELAIQSYLNAYHFRPTRAEPLYRIAILYRKKHNHLLAYLISKHALTLPYPHDDVVVEHDIYDHALLAEFAHSAHLLGKHPEATAARAQLHANLPKDFTYP
ncbi:MAG TPA: glycosyltransferase family 2 protein, partial [Chlamydiales bacterium]|nr:glycosyltransferase family 2 protein [Chlamydiales bacterium]